MSLYRARGRAGNNANGMNPRRASSRIAAYAGITICALAALSFSVHAESKLDKTKEKIDISPTMPKMKSYYGTGDLVPVLGPVIEVYGQNGTYEGVANISGQLEQPWSVEARCALGHTMVDSWIESAGEKTTVHDMKDYKKGAGVMIRGYARKTVIMEVPVTDFAFQPDPVKACNAELAVRAAKSGKSRAYLQQKGFVLKYDDALEAKARARCTNLIAATPEGLLKKLAKLGKRKKLSTLKASSTAPVYVACMPSNLHGKPAKPLPAPRKPPAIKVKMKPVDSIYARSCPTSAHFEAEAFAWRSGTIRFRYIGDGWTGPVREVQLKAGRQDLPPVSRFVGKRKKSIGDLKATASAPDHVGWMAVEILRTEENIVSEKMPYKLFCHEKPADEPTGKGVIQVPKPSKLKIRPNNAG